eukprot:9159727-Karenia_brevis.AAC.1
MSRRAPYRKVASAFGENNRAAWQAKIFSQGAWKQCSACVGAACMDSASTPRSIQCTACCQRCDKEFEATKAEK